jgi:hypothetical protein
MTRDKQRTLDEIAEEVGELMFLYHATHGLSVATMKKMVIDHFDGIHKEKVRTYGSNNAV